MLHHVNIWWVADGEREKWEKLCPLGFLSWVTRLPSPLETSKLPKDTLMALSLQECSAIFRVCARPCVDKLVRQHRILLWKVLRSGCKMWVHASAGTRVCVFSRDSLLWNMNEGLSNDYHFYSFLLPSGVHLSLSCPHVCTHVMAAITFLGLQNAYPMIDWCGWASPVLHCKISALYTLLYLFVCRDDNQQLQHSWQVARKDQTNRMLIKPVKLFFLFLRFRACLQNVWNWWVSSLCLVSHFIIIILCEPQFHAA